MSAPLAGELVHLTRGLRAGISRLHGALARGCLPRRSSGPHGSSPQPSAASEQVAAWQARLFLHGPDRSFVHHVILSNWTCWLLEGSLVRFGGPT